MRRTSTVLFAWLLLAYEPRPEVPPSRTLHGQVTRSRSTAPAIATPDAPPLRRGPLGLPRHIWRRPSPSPGPRPERVLRTQPGSASMVALAIAIGKCHFQSGAPTWTMRHTGGSADIPREERDWICQERAAPSSAAASWELCCGDCAALKAGPSNRWPSGYSVRPPRSAEWRPASAA